MTRSVILSLPYENFTCQKICTALHHQVAQAKMTYVHFMRLELTLRLGFNFTAGSVEIQNISDNFFVCCHFPLLTFRRLTSTIVVVPHR